MGAEKMYKFRVENEKILYLLGFVMGLSLVFIVLEWSRSESFVQKQASIPVINDVEEILPVVTIQSPPPPPPPKLNYSDEFNIVNDKVIYLDEPEEEPPMVLSENTNVSSVLDIPVGTVEIVDNVPPVNYAEVMPEFEGNVFEFLSKNIEYPRDALEEGAQGRVVCQFVVNKDGSIVDIQVLNPVFPSLDREAIRVIQSMPKWKPGKQGGRTVRVRFTLPVSFRLM